jgi:hypothetical protein
LSTEKAVEIDKSSANPLQIIFNPVRAEKAKASKGKNEEKLRRPMNLKKHSPLLVGAASTGGAALIVESKQKLIHQKERAPMNVGKQ